MLYISSVTGHKFQIHVFFLPVRVKRLIMPVTAGMFSGHGSVTLEPAQLPHMSPVGGIDAPSFGVEHFKNHSGRSSPNHLLPPICAAGIHDEVSVRQQE